MQPASLCFDIFLGKIENRPNHELVHTGAVLNRQATIDCADFPFESVLDLWIIGPLCYNQISVKCDSSKLFMIPSIGPINKLVTVLFILFFSIVCSVVPISPLLMLTMLFVWFCSGYR